jgi:hypothetical protein
MAGKTASTTEAQTEAGDSNRVNIRNKIFAAKPESRPVDFFGTKIELRQPTLGIILEMRANRIEDSALNMLLTYAYVPGTDEKVFEPADEESLRQLPFGPDMQRLTSAVNELLGMDMGGLEALVANAMKNTGKGTAEADNDADSAGAGEGSEGGQ